jgi:hypothetical protein
MARPKLLVLTNRVRHMDEIKNLAVQPAQHLDLPHPVQYFFEYGKILSIYG